MAESLGVGTVELAVLPDTSKFGSAIGSQLGGATTAGLAGVKSGVASASSSFGALQKAAGMAGLGIGEMTEPVGMVGEAVNGLKEKWGELPGATAKVNAAVVGLGGAMTGVGALALKLGKPIEEAHVGLETALKNTGSSYEELAPKIQKSIDKMAGFGHGSADTQTALTKLTTVTGDGNKALSEMGLVSEYAAYKHISLGAAADAVGKQLQGGSKMAKQLGIDMKSTTAASTELAAAQKADDAALKTATTAMESAAATQEKLATKYGLSKTAAAQLAAAHDAVNKAMASGDASKVYDAESQLENVTYKLSSGLKMNATDTATLAKTRYDLQQKTAPLEAADTRLAKAHDGVGASAKKGSVEEQEMAKIHGLAEAQANTFSGRLEGLKTKIENVAGTMASKWGPELLKAGPLLMGLGAAGEAVSGIMEKFKSAQEAAAVATDAMSASEDAAAVSEVAAETPILPIVIGLGLLVAAALLLWKNWGAIWQWAKDAVNDAGIAIKAVFDLLVTAIKDYLLAEIWLFKEAWDLVFSGAKAIVQGLWDFLQGAFNFIKGVFFAGIKLEILGFETIWNTVWGGVTAVAGAFIGFVEAIPARAKAAFDAVVGFVKKLLADIEAPFKAIGSLIDKLPFVGHSPSPLELHAIAAVEGVNKAFQGLRAPTMGNVSFLPTAGTGAGLTIAPGAVVVNVSGSIDQSTLPAVQAAIDTSLNAFAQRLVSELRARGSAAAA